MPGIPPDMIMMEKEYSQLISKALQKAGTGESCYILPTYTAMMDIRENP